MDIGIRPACLSGSVAAIASKSDVHRLMICALLSGSPVTVQGVSRSDDIDATARCITALGARVEFEGRDCTVTPPSGFPEHARLDCGESGSTLRFLLPVAAAVCGSADFSGAGRLPLRPIGELAQTMSDNGVEFSSPKLPFSIAGRLRAGVYTLPGDVSSQYVSGLLMALSVVAGESRVVLSSPLQSESYVNMTLSTLRLFGADVTNSDNTYII